MLEGDRLSASPKSRCHFPKKAIAHSPTVKERSRHLLIAKDVDNKI
ncbi:hypothetical protein [Phormidium nigroviride]